MSELNTNRDLYLAIDQLAKKNSKCSRTLEEYLLALLMEAEHYADRETISLNEFYKLIETSFDRTVPDFDDKLRDVYGDLPHESDDYQGCRAVLIRQIVDLREMAEQGTLENEHRFFGISSPRQSVWYNFDPIGYLECGMAGSLGGWEPDDDTGRQLVPGPVAVLGEDGTIQSANPEDIDRPTVELGHITWEQFKDFIICGQIYE